MKGLISVINEKTKEQSGRELRKMFGKNAVVSRIGKFNLIHLDNPSPQEEARRIENFDPDSLFEDDCPICSMLKKQGGNVIYDNTF